MESIRTKYFGDKAFYKLALGVALPIMLQNGVTNFVNFLDNIMVGQLGTVAVSAVSVIGQFFFVFSVFIFGGVSGGSIFGAQFYGAGDMEGFRDSFRFRLLLCALLTLLCVLLLRFFDDFFITLYLHDTSDPARVAQTLAQARDYLHILLWGFPPFALSLCYASALRDMGLTSVPMRASLLAVLVNLALNYLLIFGHMGFPALGVRGAACATVAARCAECAVVAIWSHKHAAACPFAQGAYATLRIPTRLAKDIARKGTPLLCNEVFWALGTATVNQCYSMRGLQVVAAQSISNTVVNLFNVCFLAMGSAIGILVGNLLGAGKMEEARRMDTRLIVFSVLLTAALSLVMAAFAPLFPRLYDAEEPVRLLARDLIWLTALFLPCHAYLHGSYFTLRCGGRTGLTFLYDCGFMWAVLIPAAFCISRCTALPIRPFYAAICSIELIKCAAGYFLVKSDMWLVNLTEKG